MFSFNTLLFIMDKWPLAVYFTLPFLVIFVPLKLLELKLREQKLEFLMESQPKIEFENIKLFNRFPIIKRLKELTYFALIFLSSYFVVSQRYINYSVPMGSDTAQYIYYLNNINLNPLDPRLIKLFTVPKIFFPYLLYVLWKISLLDIYSFFVYLPYALLFLFSLSFYYIITSIDPDKKELAFIIAFLTPTFYGYIRLSFDLYANLTGMILHNIALGEFIKKLKGRGNDKIFFASTGLLIFTHQFTAMFLFAILGYILIMNSLFNSSLTKKIIRERNSIILIILMIISSTLTIIFTPYVYYNYMGSKLYFYTVFDLGRHETFTFALIAVIAISYITIRFISSLPRISFLELLTISWIGIILLISLVGIGGLAWRYWILLPLPMVVGYFIYNIYFNLTYIISEILNRVKRIASKQKIKRWLFLFSKALIIVILIFAIFTHYTQLQNNISGLKMGEIPQHVFKNYMKIREKFGYSNSSIKVYINMREIKYHRWGLAIIGDVIVAGGRIDPYSKSLYGKPSWWARLFTTILVENITELLNLYSNVTIIVPKSLLSEYYEFEIKIVNDIGLYDSTTNSYIIYPR